MCAFRISGLVAFCSLTGQNALLMVNVIGNIRVQLYPNVAPFRRRGGQDYETLRNADSFVLRSGDRWRSSAISRHSPVSIVNRLRGDRPRVNPTILGDQFRPARNFRVCSLTNAYSGVPGGRKTATCPRALSSGA